MCIRDRGTITAGHTNLKAGIDLRGWSNGTHTDNSFGSISSEAISGTNTGIYAIWARQGDIGPGFRIGFSHAFTAWTKLTINGSIIYTRATANAASGNSLFQWALPNNTAVATPTSFILE